VPPGAEAAAAGVAAACHAAARQYRQKSPWLSPKHQELAGNAKAGMGRLQPHVEAGEEEEGRRTAR
jgi:hypothetical protein